MVLSRDETSRWQMTKMVEALKIKLQQNGWLCILCWWQWWTSWPGLFTFKKRLSHSFQPSNWPARRWVVGRKSIQKSHWYSNRCLHWNVLVGATHEPTFVWLNGTSDLFDFVPWYFQEELVLEGHCLILSCAKQMLCSCRTWLGYFAVWRWWSS